MDRPGESTVADMAYQISLTLDHPEEFDIPAIIEDLKREHDGIQNIDEIGGPDFWKVVRRHDVTGK